MLYPGSLRIDLQPDQLTRLREKVSERRARVDEAARKCGKEIKNVPQCLNGVCANFSVRTQTLKPVPFRERKTYLRAPQGLLMTAKLMSRSVCFEPISESALYQGTTSVVPKRASRTRAFKPLRRYFPLSSASAAFGSSTCEEDITFAAFNKARIFVRTLRPD